MAEPMPPHAILSVMIDLSKLARDVPMETLCLAFANLLADPEIQDLDEVTFGQLVSFGAGLWRHTHEFREAGEGQTRQ